MSIRNDIDAWTDIIVPGERSESGEGARHVNSNNKDRG